VNAVSWFKVLAGAISPWLRVLRGETILKGHMNVQKVPDGKATALVGAWKGKDGKR
jgi:hypothetical protein